MMMRPLAIFFDLDNTLVHREKSIDCYSKKFFLDFQDNLQDENPTSIADVINKYDNGGYPISPLNSAREAISFGLLSELNWASEIEKNDLMAHWKVHNVEHTIAMPHADETINFLINSGIKIGAISNGSHSSRVARISKLPFKEHIEILITSETFGLNKPNPKLFQAGAEKFGLNPNQCWYVGDNPINDIIGAQNAGMMAIWLKGFHHWPTEEKFPSKSINSLLEICSLF